MIPTRAESDQVTVDAAAQAYRRLRWRCRRGMLELDSLLLGFLERAEHALDEAQYAAWTALLEQSDAELSEWLLGRAEPSDSALADLVRRIRAGRVG
jgi:antitoxin CptB